MKIPNLQVSHRRANPHEGDGSVTTCPRCAGPLGCEDSRTTTAWGPEWKRRLRACHKCGYRVPTVELPTYIAEKLIIAYNGSRSASVAAALRKLADRVEGVVSSEGD